MIHYRKIGGLHWLAIGRWRVSWCYAKPNRRPLYRDCVPLRHRIIGNQAVWRELSRID